MENNYYGEGKDVIVRELVYQGGETLKNMFEDINFAIKYPLIEGKLNNNEKEFIKDLLKEMISNLDMTGDQLREGYGIYEDDEDDNDSIEGKLEEVE